MKILVVDDYDVMRLLAVTYLQDQIPDTEIFEAKNGLEAKSKLEECPASVLPDAVFTDFEMPGMNGLELMKFIKKDPILNKLPVVIMSGVGGEDSIVLKENVKNLGGYFLVKPFSYEDFRRIISEVWPAG